MRTCHAEKAHSAALSVTKLLNEKIYFKHTRKCVVKVEPRIHDSPLGTNLAGTLKISTFKQEDLNQPLLADCSCFQD